MRALLLLAAAVLAVRATLPSPLSGSAVDRLVGTDCTPWCFNSTDMLQPEVWGSTNTWCPDAHGCEWAWSVSVTPCSVSLLSFEAYVGVARTPYAQIDPATAAALQFYCSQSGSSAVLELRPIGGAAPIMTWRYQLTTCATLLADLAGGAATFVSHETNVALGVGSTWFASGATSLEATEVDCQHSRASDEASCEQCFRGADQLAVAPGGAWSDVCGATAAECQAEWAFCWNVCTGKTSHASFQMGGTPVGKLGVHGNLRAVCLASAVRGRTIVALTNVADVAALDAGQASVYVAWEYRDVDCAALMRAPRRSSLFVQRHIALERAAHTDGERVWPPAMVAAINLASGGLDDRAWGGRHSLVDSVSATASSLSGTEVGLIVGLAVTGALCIMGWALAGLLWFRGSRPREGLLAAIPLPTLWASGADPERAALVAERDEMDRIAEEDASYLHKDNATLKKEAQQRAETRAVLNTRIDARPDIPLD